MCDLFTTDFRTQYKNHFCYKYGLKMKVLAHFLFYYNDSARVIMIDITAYNVLTVDTTENYWR